MKFYDVQNRFLLELWLCDVAWGWAYKHISTFKRYMNENNVKEDLETFFFFLESNINMKKLPF